MRISIVDDNKTDREYLSEMIKHSFPGHGLSVSRIDMFESSEHFLENFEKGMYDLIFLDIYMSGASGIEAANKIRETDHTVRLVFITVSNDFASESYAVDAAYYLRKPLREEDLHQMLGRLSLPQEASESLTLPNGALLRPDSIIYSSFSGHYVTVFLISGNQLKIRCSQKEWEAALSFYPNFISCTKGVIVNINEVEKLGPNLFIMKNNAYVPVSRRRYPEVKRIYSDFLISKAREKGN